MGSNTKKQAPKAKTQAAKTTKKTSRKAQKKSEPIVVAQIMGKWVGGGVEAVIMNYYRHIDRSKVQFDFICDEDSTNIPYDEIENLGGHVILCPPYQKLPKYLKFLKQLFRGKKYAIVHSNINTLSVFPLYAAKKAGVPVRIAHSHSTSNPKEWKKNLLKNVLRPFSKRYTTDYFACSELAGRYLFGDKTFNRGEVKVIRNAIDVEKFKFDSEARKNLRKEIGIKDSDFVIGHIGRFVEQKNHRFLIDIFAEVKKEKKNVKLVLVGQGPLREEIEEKVKNLGLEKDVFFLGQRNDTNKLYSVFDVFCLPSLYEGFGVVLLEAFANGLVTITNDNTPKEAVDATESIVANDIEAWLEGLLYNNARKNDGIVDTAYEIRKSSEMLQLFYEDKSRTKVFFFCEKWQNGGLETFSLRTLSRIDDRYRKILLLGQKETNLFDKELLENNIETVVLHGAIGNPVLRTRATMQALKKSSIQKEEGQIFHINIYNAFGKKYCRIMPKNNYVILHAHNSGIDKNRDKVGLKRFVNLLARIIPCKKPNEWLACSEEAGVFCFGNKISEEYIVKNGIKTDSFAFSSKKRTAIREELGLRKDDILVGNVGRLTEQKNQLFLVDVLEGLDSKYKIVFIGDGPDYEEIVEKAQRLNVFDRVIFIKNTDKIADYLSAMDLFLFPSIYEGQGIAVIEAQCAGLPCVASDRVPEITRGSQNISYVKLERDLWIKTIREKSAFDSDRGSFCRVLKKAGFDIEATSKKISDVYKELEKA